VSDIAATTTTATTTILGCPARAFETEKDARECVSRLVLDRKGGYSVAINAEKVMRRSHDDALRAAIDGAAVWVPDGAGAVLGLRWLHGLRSLKVDFPRVTLEACDANGFRVFVLGSKEETNAPAAEKIRERYPNARVVGRIDGYASTEEMRAAIAAAEPEVVLVALGSPKQEVWAHEVAPDFPGVLFVPCGGALDALTGAVQRAPRFMVENHLEWLYRLYKQPSRWRRQLVLPRFLVRLLVATAAKRLGLAR